MKSVKHECVFEVDHSYGIAAVSLTSKARGAVCEIFDDGHIKCSDGRVLDVNRHKRRIQDDILVHRPLYFNREVHRNQKWSVRAADGSWRKGCR